MILLETFQRLRDIALDENATANELFFLALAFAVVWAVFFAISGALIRPLIYNKPWLIQAGRRDYHRNGKELYEKVGVLLTEDEYVVKFMSLWPWNVNVCIQHAMGGLLCVPSIMGWFTPELSASLACLGIISEMGWEIQDLLTWVIKRYTHPNGYFEVPMAFIIVLGIHHSLTCSLGIPIVLNFRALKLVHWMCLDLQFAGASTIVITEYTKTLQVTVPNELRQFQAWTLFGLVVACWTRGIHWLYLCYKIIVAIRQANSPLALTLLASLIAVIFTLFNWVFVIQPYFRRFQKFQQASAEYTALPATADKQQRRSSIMELEQAAASVAQTALVLQDEMLSAALQFNSYNNNKATRRSTMPPSMFGSQPQQSISRRRLSSIAMLGSSTSIDVSSLISSSKLEDELKKDD